VGHGRRDLAQLDHRPHQQTITDRLRPLTPTSRNQPSRGGGRDSSDADTTYLELRIHDLVLRDQFSGILPLDTVRRLRDQLTEHLDAVQ
jgi:hypothetical protein